MKLFWLAMNLEREREIYINIYIYIHTYVFIYLFIYLCVYLFIYLFIYVSIYLFIHMPLSLGWCVCYHGWFLGFEALAKEMVEPLTKPSPDVGFAQKTLFKAPGVQLQWVLQQCYSITVIRCKVCRKGSELDPTQAAINQQQWAFSPPNNTKHQFKW